MAVSTYKCPNCGSVIAFAIETQRWRCEHCNSDFSLGEMRASRAAKSKTETLTEFAEDVRAYSCPSCGARIVADANTAATFCLFCRNPTLLDERLSGKYQPSRVIPFKIGEAAARKAYRKLCDRFLVPPAFKKKEHIDHIRGLYAPFWLFTCSSRARGTVHCETVKTWSTSSHDYTQTDVYNLEARGDFFFNGVPADGSKALDDDMMGSIEPFAYQDLVPFEKQYLAGHLAECYDVSDDQVLPQVFSRMRKGIEAAFLGMAAGYTTAKVQSCDIDVVDVGSEYVMAPVWILVSKFRNKDYVFAMNGQTGKIVGNLPISLPRVAALAGVAAAVAVYLYWNVVQYLW